MLDLFLTAIVTADLLSDLSKFQREQDLGARARLHAAPSLYIGECEVVDGLIVGSAQVRALCRLVQDARCPLVGCIRLVDELVEPILACWAKHNLTHYDVANDRDVARAWLRKWRGYLLFTNGRPASHFIVNAS